MAEKGVWTIRVAGTIALLSGILLAWGAWHVFSTHDHMVRAGVAVEGRMTGAYREVRQRNVSNLYPTVSYRTREGRVIVGPLEHSVALAEIRRDRIVPLVYDPDAPERVLLASAVGEGAGVLPWILAGAGLAVGGLGVAVLVRGRKVRA